MICSESLSKIKDSTRSHQQKRELEFATKLANFLAQKFPKIEKFLQRLISIVIIFFNIFLLICLSILWRKHEMKN